MAIIFPMLALAVVAQERPNTEDVEYVASAYANCLHYEAIRSHEKGAEAEILVFAARQSCRVEQSLWRVMMEMLSERENPKNTKQEIKIAFDILEQRYVRSVIATIEPIIDDANALRD